MVKLGSQPGEEFGTVIPTVSIQELAKDGKVNAIEDFITADGVVRVDYSDATRCTLLHYAARYNKPDVVKLLISHGATVNVQNKEGLTPLHFAARRKERLEIKRERTGEASTGGNSDFDGFADFLMAGSAEPEVQSTIQLLLETAHINPNLQDSYGQTPLHYTAIWGNGEECRQLLRLSTTNKELKDKKWMTALHLAIFHCQDTVAKLLIEANADIFVEDRNERLPYHLVADVGRKNVITDLINRAKKMRGKKRMLAARDIDGNTGLCLAVIQLTDAHYEIVQTILAEGYDEIKVANKQGDTPLHCVAQSGNMTILNKLLNVGEKLDVNGVNKRRASALHIAAKYNRNLCVGALIRGGDMGYKRANINARDEQECTPLMVASENGHSAVCDLILQNSRVDISAVDRQGRTALYLAAENNHLKTLQALLDETRAINLQSMLEDGNEKGMTPLHITALNGHLECLKYLLRQKAEVRCAHYGGKTPLHLATKFGHLNIVRVLLQYPGTISDHDDKLNTALHIAARYGHYQIAQLLLREGASFIKENSEQMTPLLCAAEAGWIKTCRILVEAGSDIHHLDRSQRSPLQLACRQGHAEIVEYLISMDARLDHLDVDGNNCLDIAIASLNEDVARIIIESNAWENSLQNCTDRCDTPVRKLIRHMPNLAEVVFTRCLAIEKDIVTFDYKFVDDMYRLRQWGKKDRVRKTDNTRVEYEDIGGYKKNHILMVIVLSHRLELLAHPLISGLLRRKWKSFAVSLFYITLFIYTIFLAFLTSYMVVTDPPYSFDSAAVSGSVGDTLCEKLDSSGYKQPTFQRVSKYFIIALAAILIITELCQFFQARKNYISIENLLEWVIFVFSLILVIDLRPCQFSTGFRFDWQWSIGAAALFFAWINLVLFLQRFPTFGIYVVMFKDILNTFIEFFVVYALFIIAFALAFYSELRNMAAFEYFSLALVKTSVMMTGEFDFGDDFVAGDVKHELSSYLLFSAFSIMMTIIVMNLLVGLAVDNIKEVQDKAALTRLRMQVELILELESVVPEYFRRRAILDRPDDVNLRVGKWPFKLHKKFGLESYGISRDKIAAALNPEMTDIRRIKEEQETLKRQGEKMGQRIKQLEGQSTEIVAMLRAIMDKVGAEDDTR